MDKVAKASKGGRHDFNAEYMENFSEKIFWPVITNENMVLNPQNNTLMYSMTTCAIHDDTKFIPYVFDAQNYRDLLENEFGSDYEDTDSDNGLSIEEEEESEDESDDDDEPSEESEESEVGRKATTVKSVAMLTTEEEKKGDEFIRENAIGPDGVEVHIDSEEEEEESGVEAFIDESHPLTHPDEDAIADDKVTKRGSDAKKKKMTANQDKSNEEKTKKEDKRPRKQRKQIIRRKQVVDQFEVVKRLRMEEASKYKEQQVIAGPKMRRETTVPDMVTETVGGNSIVKETVVSDRGTLVSRNTGDKKGTMAADGEGESDSDGLSSSDGGDKDEKYDYASYFEKEFEFLKVQNCGKNLVNAKKILSQWEIDENGYKKIGEVFIFDELKDDIVFCPSGSHLMVLTNTADQQGFIIYDKWLKRKGVCHQLRDSDGDLLTTHTLELMNDGKYILAHQKDERLLFNQEGRLLKYSYSHDLERIQVVNSTQVIGHKQEHQYAEFHIQDVKKDTIWLKCKIEPYTYQYFYNADFSGVYFDQYPKLYYQELSNKSEMIKLMDYNILFSLAHKGNITGILYSDQHGKIIYSQYQNGKLMWDEPLGRSGNIDISSMSIDGNKVVIVENSNNSHRVWFIQDEKVSSFLIKPMRCLKDAYPFIILLYGTDEIWVIPLEDSKRIQRYYMESLILGIEN